MLFKIGSICVSFLMIFFTLISSASALVASIIGSNHVSDETENDISKTSQESGKGIKRLAINDTGNGENNGKDQSVEPEPSKKPRIQSTKEVDTPTQKDLEEDYQSTLS